MTEWIIYLTGAITALIFGSFLINKIFKKITLSNLIVVLIYTVTSWVGFAALLLILFIILGDEIVIYKKRED